MYGLSTLRKSETSFFVCSTQNIQVGGLLKLVGVMDLEGFFGCIGNHRRERGEFRLIVMYPGEQRGAVEASGGLLASLGVVVLVGKEVA